MGQRVNDDGQDFPGKVTHRRHFFFLSRSFTGGPNSSCEMIILCNNSHGGIIRFFMGIFTTALRNKKKTSNVKRKITHLTSTAYCLLFDRILWWKEPILGSCPFRGFLHEQKKPKAELSISEHPFREAKNPSAKSVTGRPQIQRRIQAHIL